MCRAESIRTTRLRSQSGLALITALLILSFLSIIGGALLGSTTVDVRIAYNYRTNTQLLFLAEAGIEAGREALRNSANTVDTDLVAAAGVDAVISTSLDLTTLLAADDQPWLPSAVALRATGETLNDTVGDVVGTYHVFLRNDVADGETTTADSNDVLTFVSIARIGDGIKTIEALVKRDAFPPIPAALTINGNVGLFDAANSNLFQIDGIDQAGGGVNEHAIGVISAADDTTVTSAIPANRVNNYTGDGGVTPDVEDISGELSGPLTTVSGLESIVESISSAATDTYTPGFGNSTSIGSIGGASDYRIVVVNGDATVGPGTGYGVLLVRGALSISGNLTWYGLILVIGQGEIHWNGGGNGEIQGGMFLAKTRDTPSVSSPLGDLLPMRGDVIADFNGGGGSGILYNTLTIENAMGRLPYVPMSITEY